MMKNLEEKPKSRQEVKRNDKVRISNRLNDLRRKYNDR